MCKEKRCYDTGEEFLNKSRRNKEIVIEIESYADIEDLMKLFENFVDKHFRPNRLITIGEIR